MKDKLAPVLQEDPKVNGEKLGFQTHQKAVADLLEDFLERFGTASIEE